MEVDISSSPRLIKQSLSNSVIRYNRARLERLRRAREEADFEKIFKQSFWSYSKSMLKQPLSVLEGEKGDELEDIALKLFYTIQQHAGIYIYIFTLQASNNLVITTDVWCVCVSMCTAGIPPSNGSGFTEIEADDCVTMVQLATQKCLEKESICNEFYLQLIKQTTDQPGRQLKPFLGLFIQD